MSLSAPVVFKVIVTKRGHAKKSAARHLIYIDSGPETGVRHAQYLDGREGSSGIFDSEGPASLSAIESRLSAADGPFWRMVISLKEVDAQSLTMTQATWQAAAGRFMVGATKILAPESGSINWVAAHHEKQGHPHVHILAWARAPERPERFSKSELRVLRRAAVDSILGPERLFLIMEQQAARDSILATARRSTELFRGRPRRSAEFAEATDMGAAPNISPIPPTLAGIELRELRDRLERLAQILPLRGAVKLQYMPLNVKAESMEIAAWLLQSSAARPQLWRFRQASQTLTSYYRTDIDAAVENAQARLQTRVAQVILRAAVAVSHESHARIPLSAARNLWSAVCRSIRAATARLERESHVEARLLALRQDWGARERGGHNNNG